jgi:hypothetical protein
MPIHLIQQYWPQGLLLLAVWILGANTYGLIHTHTQTGQHNAAIIRQVLRIDNLMAQTQAESLALVHQAPDQAIQAQITNSHAAWQAMSSHVLDAEIKTSEAAYTDVLTIWQRLQQLRQHYKDDTAHASSLDSIVAYNQFGHALEAQALQLGQQHPAAMGLITLRQFQAEIQTLQLQMADWLSTTSTHATLAPLLTQTLRVQVQNEQGLYKSSQQQQQLFAEVIDPLWQPISKDLLNLIDLDDQTVLSERLPQYVQRLGDLNQQLTLLITERQNYLENLAQAPLTDSMQLLSWWWVCMGVIPAITVLGTLIWHRQWQQRLNGVLQWTHTMACGNLTVAPHPSWQGGDLLGQSVQAIDEIRHHWRRTLADIHHYCQALQAAKAVQTGKPAQETTDKDAFKAQTEQQTEAPPHDHYDHGPEAYAQSALNLPQPDLAGLPMALGQHLSTLLEASHQLQQQLNRWHDPMPALDQQLDDLTQPVKRQMTALAYVLTQSQQLSHFVEALEQCAHKSQHLLQQAQANLVTFTQADDPTSGHSAQIPDNQNPDSLTLAAIAQQNTQLQQELTTLQQQLNTMGPVPGQMLISTSLNSKTSPKISPSATPPHSADPLTGLWQLLQTFTY